MTDDLALWTARCIARALVNGNNADAIALVRNGIVNPRPDVDALHTCASLFCLDTAEPDSRYCLDHGHITVVREMTREEAAKRYPNTPLPEFTAVVDDEIAITRLVDDILSRR